MKKTTNNTIIYEYKPCAMCNHTGKPGFTYGDKICPVCNGNGRSKKGLGKGQCNNCHGFKTVVNFEAFKVCGCCNGTGKEFENAYSYMNNEIWKDFNFIVIRLDRSNTFNENYLGFGSVYSCTDYGRSYNSEDQSIIEEVRNNNSCHQVIHVLENDKSIQLPETIGIYVTKNGYSVKPIFDR